MPITQELERVADVLSRPATPEQHSRSSSCTIQFQSPRFTLSPENKTNLDYEVQRIHETDVESEELEGYRPYTAFELHTTHLSKQVSGVRRHARSMPLLDEPEAPRRYSRTGSPTASVSQPHSRAESMADYNLESTDILRLTSSPSPSFECPDIDQGDYDLVKGRDTQGAHCFTCKGQRYLDVPCNSPEYEYLAANWREACFTVVCRHVFDDNQIQGDTRVDTHEQVPNQPQEIQGDTRVDTHEQVPNQQQEIQGDTRVDTHEQVPNKPQEIQGDTRVDTHVQVPNQPQETQGDTRVDTHVQVPNQPQEIQGDTRVDTHEQVPNQPKEIQGDTRVDTHEQVHNQPHEIQGDTRVDTREQVPNQQQDHHHGHGKGKPETSKDIADGFLVVTKVGLEEKTSTVDVNNYSRIERETSTYLDSTGRKRYVCFFCDQRNSSTIYNRYKPAKKSKMIREPLKMATASVKANVVEHRLGFGHQVGINADLVYTHKSPGIRGQRDGHLSSKRYIPTCKHLPVTKPTASSKKDLQKCKSLPDILINGSAPSSTVFQTKKTFKIDNPLPTVPPTGKSIKPERRSTDAGGLFEVDYRSSLTLLSSLMLKPQPFNCQRNKSRGIMPSALARWTPASSGLVDSCQNGEFTFQGFSALPQITGSMQVKGSYKGGHARPRGVD